MEKAAEAAFSIMFQGRAAQPWKWLSMK
jgi:hypothetical protein